MALRDLAKELADAQGHPERTGAILENLAFAWLKFRQPVGVLVHGLREARLWAHLHAIRAHAPYRRGSAEGSVGYAWEILTTSTRPGRRRFSGRTERSGETQNGPELMALAGSRACCVRVLRQVTPERAARLLRPALGVPG